MDAFGQADETVRAHYREHAQCLTFDRIRLPTASSWLNFPVAVGLAG
jgi:hypothetical protein